MSKYPQNQMWLDLRCEEGRAQVGVSVDGLSPAERMWLMRLLESVGVKGTDVEFGVGTGPDGEHVIQFTIKEIKTSPQAGDSNVVSIQ